MEAKKEYGITTTAMLSRLKLGMWTPSKFDKKASARTAKQNGVEDKVIRLNKNLFPFECETYSAVKTAFRLIREEFNELTLPWLDDGTRITTAANFMELNRRIREKEDAIEAVLPPFFERWPFLKAQSKVALNGLYVEEDFPDIAKLKERFTHELKFYPIPDAADFRTELSADALETIKQQITADQKSAVSAAMEEPYLRLHDGVAHMAARLSGAKTCPCRKCKGKEYSTDQFGDSLIDNLIDMCETLPRLNLTGDPELTQYVEKVKVSLTAFKPDEVRGSEPLKKTLAERAAEIQRDLAGYMMAS